MRHSVRTIVVLLAAGLVVLAAGCGGGSNSSAPPTTGATSTQQMTTSGGGGMNFASSKNCLAFAGLASQIAKAVNPTGSSSPQKAAQTLQALADAAPSDIKGDLQTIASAFSSFLQAAQNAGYNFSSTARPTAAQIAALTNAARAFSTAKLTQAEQHLSTWEAQNCHS